MLVWADIRLLYLRELRSALRERNIVFHSILLPILLYPLLLWLMYTGFSFVSGQTEGFSSRVMLKNLPEGHGALKVDLERDEQIQLKNSVDPASDIRNGSLDALVDFAPLTSEPASLEGNFRVQLTFDNSKDRSATARSRLADRLERYRDRYLEAEARKLGLAPEQIQQFRIESKNVATSREMGQFILGLMLPITLIIMICIGCMHPAIDCTAGEREKSTWETLMTVATSRKNIVVAKYLYVATMASLAAILNLIAMVFSTKAILGPLIGERAEGYAFQISLGSLPLILLVIVLLALFVSAGMMILASFARTLKEGQSLVNPFYIAIILPVMFLQVPGLEFTPLLAMIPVVNVAMAFREAIAGTFQWHLLGITIGVEIVCLALALWLATAILRYEDFLVGSYGGSLGKFLKERLLEKRRRGVER